MRNFREQIEKLKVREEKCSISISDFLLDNYKKEKLFFEPYHPTRIVLREKTKRILKKLNIEYVPHGKLIGADDSYEVFVYECVAQALGVEWRDQLIRNCRVEYTLYNRSINLEEYINQYMLWSEEIETTNIHI